MNTVKLVMNDGCPRTKEWIKNYYSPSIHRLKAVTLSRLTKMSSEVGGFNEILSLLFGNTCTFPIALIFIMYCRLILKKSFGSTSSHNLSRLRSREYCPLVSIAAKVIPLVEKK